ncbi:hypothetical protein LJC10_01385 [Selenomonadales bacterium OttesenSCG-928-I06]|nr:hypothetical protein [Selenomonadales bacterium OttesenSCG-928-I06]
MLYNNISNDMAVCANCFQSIEENSSNCPACGTNVIFDGENKSVIDRIEPNCLIHRYEGSDLLEPAFLIKEARANCKVATRLKEYPKPITVPKSKVYKFDDKILGSVKALRNERTATMYRYDQLIGKHFEKLQPFNNDN